MKKYSNIEITGSISLTGSFIAPSDLILQATASNAVSSSHSDNAVSSSVAITSNFAERAATYSIPETGGGSSTNWVHLGTWDTIQNGQTLHMKVIAHNGYSSTPLIEDQVTELFFKTSNGTSNTGGFYGNANATVSYRLGSNRVSPSLFRIVQTSLTKFQIYGVFSTFTSGSTYSVKFQNGTSWTHVGEVKSEPTGTVLNETPVVDTVVPTGGTAGQLLTKVDNSNYNVQWSSASALGAPLWIGGGAIGINGTTTAPTKANVITDESFYRQIGSRQWEVAMVFNKAAGGTDGAGDYLLSIPAGAPNIQNFSIQPFWTADINSAPVYFQVLAMPTSYGSIFHNITAGTTAQVLLWDARTFRLLIHVPGTALRNMGQFWFPFSGATGFQLRFQYQSV
jgi:hypothetical protein